MSDLDKQLDRALRNILIVAIILVVFTSVWAIGIYTNEKTYQCTVTGQDSNNWAGGRFYEVSCGSGIHFSNVAGGQRYACARIGDTVTVKTYNGWYAIEITGDSSC